MSQLIRSAQAPVGVPGIEGPGRGAARRLWMTAGLTAASLVGGVLLIEDMTYAKLHLFLLVPLACLMFLPGSPMSHAPRAVRLTGYAVPPVLAVVATFFSHFWDNYIASRGVWTFDASTMLGTAASIPYEEYFWFIDHTFLASFFAMSLWTPRQREVSALGHGLLRLVLPLLCAVLCYVGIGMLDSDRTVYLGIILAYMPPVMASHFAIGGHVLASRPVQWLVGIAVPSVYLIGIDTWAIRRGVWAISDTYTTGLHLAGIKLEQVLIYSTTTVLVVQTMVCLLRAAEVMGTRRERGESLGEALWRLSRAG